MNGKVQVGKDQEKAQSENDSHSKNRDGEKTKLTIRKFAYKYDAQNACERIKHELF